MIPLPGGLDPSFGAAGVTRLDVAGADERGRTLVAPADGRTVLVGSGKPSASNLDGTGVRRTASGSPDAAFKQGGRRLVYVGGTDDSLFGVALSPRSRLAVVGYPGRDPSGGGKDDGAISWLQP